MSLFFDSAWFDARLAAAGLRRTDVAVALGLSDAEIAELWKDQRELSAGDVRLFAALLGVAAEELASRAGISTPAPRADASDIDARLTRIERELAQIKALLRR